MHAKIIFDVDGQPLILFNGSANLHQGARPMAPRSSPPNDPLPGSSRKPTRRGPDPSDLLPGDRSLLEGAADYAWNVGLVALCVIGGLAGLGALVSVLAKGFAGGSIDDVLKFFVFSVLCIVVLQFGDRITSVAFGGAKIEFLKKQAAAKNIRELELNDLKLEVGRLKKAISSGSGAPAVIAKAVEDQAREPHLPTITVPDDPQKNRFGGRPDRHGYALSASFLYSSPNDPIVSVTLAVTCPRTAAPESARFYLHDSFIRPEVSVPFEDGVATLRLSIGGGFTVGVWIEGTHGDDAVLLELDLSKLEGAPKVVVER